MNEELAIANDVIAVRVAPQFGMRVTSLVDKRTGRNWLVPGALEGSSGDDASFLAAAARGWDECFPTVAPCHNAHWGRDLRDHGDIWGRPTAGVATDDEINCTYTGETFLFRRGLKLQGNNVLLEYAVTNTGSAALPYMWSQHCLLATGPKDRLFIEGVASMNVTVSGGIAGQTPKQFIWPKLNEALPDLRVILDIDAGMMLKSYAAAEGHVHAGVTGDKGGISFLFEGTEMPFLGLWLDYGYWPEDAPVHQIALEPTTAGADDLATAEQQGQARLLAPGTTHKWAMTIRLTEQD